ncbi:tyrosine--tRNA ligase [Candidatus Oleimmundimicrobium sp.]|uniref:tyrosine--tRNA ligase n=1 Tax=Candidatus Oleimmundimicrobium sp. TaxID=3060597 RepID=UPI00272898F9|nr:tyrosine--tRNA ligase [Candidatus Oleimmundimicrobium sp.]MDO8886123.1 tyrosine--tRNA ligase [Candidatus Oleimmundimicrobium sp.]
MINFKEQLDTLIRGTEEILPLDEFKNKLKRSIKENKPLIIKYGVDPTSPDLHIGHAIPLRKLRQFQDFGHKVILLIGDFTARIGDPSQKSATRPQLSGEEIVLNAKTYTKQAFNILDEKSTIVDYNSRWFGKMSFEEILKLTANFTVARLLERDDFYKRYQENIPIGLHEFLYPVMQGYDSVMLESDVELGGTDQKFNMLAGRNLQKIYDQEPQVVFTLPILEGIDGVQKMSKSLGNHVGITDEPKEMFGKIMSIPDELMIKYFKLTTTLSEKEIKKIGKGLKDESLHPAKIKRRLAREIVSQCYDQKIAQAAEKEFDTVFKEKSLPSNIPEVKLAPQLFKDGRIWIVQLIKEAGFVKTNGEAKRLIEQGGVKLNNEVIEAADVDLKINNGDILQIGKRRFAKFIRT